MLFLKKYSLLSLLLCAHFSVLLSMSPQEKAERKKSIKRRIEQNNLMSEKHLRALLKQTNSGKKTAKKQAQQTNLQQALETIQTTNSEKEAQKQIQAITTYVSPQSKAETNKQLALAKRKKEEKIKIISAHTENIIQKQKQLAMAEKRAKISDVVERQRIFNPVMAEVLNSFALRLKGDVEQLSNLNSMTNNLMQKMTNQHTQQWMEQSITEASLRSKLKGSENVINSMMEYNNNSYDRWWNAIQERDKLIAKLDQASETARRALEIYNQGMSIYDQQKEQNANMLNMVIEEVVGADKSIEDNLKNEYTAQRQYKKQKEAQERERALAADSKQARESAALVTTQLTATAAEARQLALLEKQKAEERLTSTMQLRDATAQQKEKEHKEKLRALENSAQAERALSKANIAEKEEERALLEANLAEKEAAMRLLKASLAQKEELLQQANDRYNNQLYIKTANWIKANPGWAAGLGLGGAAAGLGYAGYHGKLPENIQLAFNKATQIAIDRTAKPGVDFMSKVATQLANNAPKTTWNTVTSYLSNGFSSLGNSLSNTFSKLFGK